MSEKIIQSIDFKKELGEDWNDSLKLFQFMKETIRQSKILNPYTEIYLKANHYNSTTNETKEVYGRFIFSDDVNFVIHDNPWKGEDYYASLHPFKEERGWIVPRSSLTPESLENEEFLWVQTEEIEAVELHTPFANNKKMAFVLERVDLDE